MSDTQTARGLSRRALLASSVSAGAVLAVGSGFVLHTTDAWALETQALQPRTMATLIQMARDIYPHDRIPDANYAIAVKGHDETAAADAAFGAMIEAGVADLDARAKQSGADSYLDLGWESDRVAILQAIESEPFFQTIRGGLVVGLYNQPEIWPLFGYEGSSAEHGGYIERGFDDIAWL
ncbi:MAG: Twin-arginine translocation pathway signal [Geminicoccaceae bacterium]